ncbi:MAG TPA: recombinase family protein [Ktedonobacterales bacterium]
MTPGYARVSTQDQTLDLQQDALTVAGCTRIFTDTMSGAKAERTGLAEAFDHLRAGDTLVVWRLDRLGRTLKDLIDLVARLEREGIAFKSLTEQLDTTPPTGTLIFHLFGSLVEFKRALIRERTQAGLVAARARGRNRGRPGRCAGKTPSSSRWCDSSTWNSVPQLAPSVSCWGFHVRRSISASSGSNPFPSRPEGRARDETGRRRHSRNERTVNPRAAWEVWGERSTWESARATCPLAETVSRGTIRSQPAYQRANAPV